ncbi:HAD family hydrolase [Sulfuracidifex tepidarius]|uniref:Pyrophosphatase PpaX n=1 Tax=Sulfuracidifex tepidarius TaxID=1294262 RepID=A0A510DWA4_9CREN|nr:HAD-IA family hydrolase [Sulfuracidifex tepidarius]BBG24280.1 Pyrophosphatase PpaX [Sulfuracidifex tepidarius]BBG27037.1 Pyrophosphatase PpaX [Sulfuracidifex tepidarius]
MKLEVISLDLGDTLVHNEPWGYQIISDLLKDLGYSVSSKQIFRTSAKLRGKKLKPNPNGNNTPSLREVFSELNINISDDEIKIIEDANKQAEKEVFLYDDVIDFLETVRSMDIKTVLVSNAAYNGKAKKHLETFGLRKYFDKVVFSFEVGKVKPDPEIFKIAIANPRENAIHLGDIYEVDVLGAVNACLQGALIDRRQAYEEIDDKYLNLRDFLRNMEKAENKIIEKECIKERDQN